MGMKCSHCGWEGESEDRVPATAEWIAANGVDANHFTSHSLNCPGCGESSAWQFTGEDEDDHHPLDYPEKE
jgi:predicted RNA-binding Zn-ribbon protein involved in translation (DUF1610 family)